MMDFSDALVCLKAGIEIRRAGWNGKGMWLYLANGVKFHRLTLEGPPNKRVSGGASLHQMVDVVNLAPFIVMHAADGSQVPWLASQTDILASDWESARRFDD